MDYTWMELVGIEKIIDYAKHVTKFYMHKCPSFIFMRLIQRLQKIRIYMRYVCLLYTYFTYSRALFLVHRSLSLETCNFISCAEKINLQKNRKNSKKFYTYQNGVKYVVILSVNIFGGDKGPLWDQLLLMQFFSRYSQKTNYF